MCWKIIICKILLYQNNDAWNNNVSKTIIYQKIKYKNNYRSEIMIYKNNNMSEIMMWGNIDMQNNNVQKNNNYLFLNI